MAGRIGIRRIIFSLVIVLMLVMMALLVANLPPIDAENEALYLECDISPTTTKVGHEIDCRAAASGGDSSYSWSWTVNGEEVASFQNTAYTNITRTFNEPGVYEVCVNVTDSSEPQNEYQCCTPVTVTGDLSLECGVSPNPTKVGHVTSFYATASGGDSNYSYFWDFGDGVGNSMDEDPTYIYTTYGDYTVCVNVTDSSEPENEEQCRTPVTVNPPLYLECDISPNPTDVGHEIDCTAAASGGVPPYSWSWTVNGTEVESFQNTASTHITRTFNEPGVYEVCITVTDSLGNVESCPTLVTVNEELYSLVLLPESATNILPGDDSHEFTVTVKDQYGDPMAGQNVSLETTFGNLSVDQVTTGIDGIATFTISSDETGTATITATLGDLTDTATKTWTTAPPPTPGGGGGGGSCPATRYLTVDWDENITKKPLLNNDRLAVDLLGPSPDGRHSLLLERGTLAPTVNGKQHYLIVIRELEETLPLSENTIAIVAINATPAGAVFDRDIFLTLGFDELPENALNATMAYYDDVNEVWVLLESEPGGPSGVAKLTLSAPINHFTIFAVLVELAPPPPPPLAHFVPSGLNVVTSVEKIWEPVTFVTKIGESVTITANVLNDGGQEGIYTVELKLNGETVDTKTVTLGAGQSQQVSFTVSGLDYGQYEVEVAGLSGDFTTSRTITWWLIIVIIVAVGLISWGVVWIRRGRKAHQAA